MAANPFAAQDLRSPTLGPRDAARIARERYGLGASARELGSYQDQNFLLDTPAGRFVLKVANPGFTTEGLELQDRAMAHVAGRVGVEIPRTMPDRDGAEIAEAATPEGAYRVRLLTYVEGAPLREWSYLHPSVLRAVGVLAGRMAGALTGFEHPGADRVLQWDLQHAADVVAAFAPGIEDAERRAQAERAAERAAAALERLEPQLPRQVIHGDVTDFNVLARRDACGRPVPCALIDFGDATRTRRAAECAVAVAALCAREPSRVPADAAHLVAGFCARLPLDEAEVAALHPMVLARAALSAVSADQQAAVDPANRYVTDYAEDAWAALAAFAAVPDALAIAVLRPAAGLAPLARRPVPAPDAPLLEGTDVADAPVVDLSTETDALHFGAWRSPEPVARAVAAAGPVTVGRHGEGRIVHDAGPAPAVPASVHLGLDVFVAAGTSVAAPLAARVLRAGPTEVLLDPGRGERLRLAGIEPTVAAGDDLAAGDAVGRVAASAGRLPPHVHVQWCAEPVDELPGLASGALAAAWLELCPDPAALLGRRPGPGVGRRDPALRRRTASVARAHPLYYAPDPRRIERGWRQHLYDTDGRPYLDVVNNVAVLGHSHPRVAEAAARQLRLLNTNSRFLYDAMGRFAERLVELAPPPLDTVFLVSSGSEANEVALRLVREVTGRRDVLCLTESYHGWTDATAELEAGRPAGERERPVTPPRIHAITKPNLYNGPHRGSGAEVAETYAREAVAAVEALCADGRPPAGFISEALLGNSGGIPLPDRYLERLYGAVRAAGGLCIADEVQVGYGRLGEYFWGFEQQGVVPDVISIAKCVGNGHPVAAVICSRAVADAFADANELFASVGGSPVSCEVGLAVLDVLAEEGLQANALAVGAHLQERLQPLLGSAPLAGALHGVGLYRGLELVRDGDPGRPATEEAYAVCDRMLDLGVVAQPTGPGMNIVKLKPPLCVTRADVDHLGAVLEAVLTGGW